MSGNKTISTSETKLETLRFQSSAYGVTIPVVYGVTRIPGNLLWFGGFKPIPHTSSQSAGGKGGETRMENTTYTYTAAVILGLCEGDITGIGSIWRGKNQYTGGATPSQIVYASQNYTIPVGGGSVTVTLPGGATYATNLNVKVPTGGGESGSDPWYANEGGNYGRVGGTYTFGGAFQGIPDGTTVQIQYQYRTSAAVQTSLNQLGMSLAFGQTGQAVWSYLTTNYPAQAIGYSGLAFVYASAYDLGPSAQVENHTFEVQAKYAYTIGSTVPDISPASVALDILTNKRYGAIFDSVKIGDLNAWYTYTLAANLLMSPALTEQQKAADLVSTLCKLSNTAPFWSEGVLKLAPYGDVVVTGNSTTYTPNTTPQYDLDDRYFLDKANPVKLVRKPQADAYNHIRVEFINRANQYNVEVAEAKDQANIDQYGLRSAQVLQAHWICDGAVARNVAQLLLQRSLFIRNTYKFKLPLHFSRLEPMDLVTLTDARLGLNLTPVRVTIVDEPEDGELHVEAEDWPLGVASATAYPVQYGAGFSHDYNAAPGNVDTPFIFELPANWSATGLEVAVMARGATPANWGGCTVWCSNDGSNYKQIGKIYGPSRYGTLNGTVSGGTVSVNLPQGSLTTGSSADATNLSTLVYIGGSNPEFVAHTTASFVGSGNYTLTIPVRGQFNTPTTAHVTGDKWARVDQAMARSGPLDLDQVGKTLYFKLTSFNVYGLAEQDIASVSAYTYAVTGRGVKALATSRGLIDDANTVITESGYIRKVSGAANTWDAAFRSVDGFKGGAFVSARPATPGSDIFIGLSTAPAANNSYTAITYGIYSDGGGNVSAWSNGVQLSGLFACSLLDQLMVLYDGNTVQWIKNGVPFWSANVASQQTLYVDGTMFNLGATLMDVFFGPASQVADIATRQMLPQSATVVAVAKNSSALVTDPTASNTLKTTDAVTLSYTNDTAGTIDIQIEASCAQVYCSGYSFMTQHAIYLIQTGAVGGNTNDLITSMGANVGELPDGLSKVFQYSLASGATITAKVQLQLAAPNAACRITMDAALLRIGAIKR